jgi:hypothetical protein
MRRWLVGGALAGTGCARTADEAALDALRAPPDGSVAYGGFQGHTPCDAPCEKRKVGLALHETADDAVPTTFVLEQIYVADGNTRHVTEGTWSWIAAPAWFPEARVLRLEADPHPTSTLPEGSDRVALPAAFGTWLSLQDVVLQALDADLEPRVGDGSESWTLDRTD